MGPLATIQKGEILYHTNSHVSHKLVKGCDARELNKAVEVYFWNIECGKKW